MLHQRFYVTEQRLVKVISFEHFIKTFILKYITKLIITLILLRSKWFCDNNFNVIGVCEDKFSLKH